MVEELAFFGIRNVRDVATCLDGYDQTHYPARQRLELHAVLRAAGGGRRLPARR